MKLDIKPSLENIYISPLEGCNLNCSYCYTKKTKDILSNQQILDFINKYQIHLTSENCHLRSVLFCGGEIFTLPDFPKLVNTLIQKDIFITIITNGTIDRLTEINDPKNCQLLVSLDGPRKIHDQNRGTGNFDKTVDFINSALQKGFPVEIMFLITKDSYPFKDSFSSYLDKLYNLINLKLTYLTDRQMSLSKEQLLDIKTNYKTYPAKNFGCFQLSLQSTGTITACCESNVSLGNISDNPSLYIANFIKSLSKCNSCVNEKSLKIKKNKLKINSCNGCSDPDYLCGYKTELNLKSCKNVINLFVETSRRGVSI